MMAKLQTWKFWWFASSALSLTVLNLMFTFILRLVYDFRVIKGTVRSAFSATAALLV